jgi:hypothetical protein
MAREPIEQCKAAIVSMLEANNRPFNGTNLVDDVAESFKKTLVVKALAALTVFFSILEASIAASSKALVMLS